MSAKVHTFGCSFTQYSYPTWADFIAMHYDVDVINHALPGYGNDIIKKKLYTINSTDYVCMMFTGAIRESNYFDYNFAKQIESTDNDLIQKFNKFSFEGQKGYYVPINKYFERINVVESHTNLIYKNFETILDCLNLCKLKKFPHIGMAWCDLTPNQSFADGLHTPGNHLLNYFLGPNTLKTKLDWEETAYIVDIIEQIEDSNWIGSVKSGLFEHHWTNRSLVAKQPKCDAHPTSLGNFDYFVTHIKPILDNTFNAKNNLQHLEQSTKNLVEYFSTLTEKEYKKQITSNDQNGWSQDQQDKKNKLIKEFYG